MPRGPKGEKRPADVTRQPFAAVSTLAGPVVLSCFGAAYFGYQNDPYRAVIIWTLICTAGFLIWSRLSFRYAINLADSNVGRAPLWAKVFFMTTIAVQVALSFLVCQSAVFFLVWKNSN